MTFITARHHIRTSNSSVEARSHSACGITDGALNVTAPRLTSALFTDAYHYMGWFLTIPLLTTETLLVMKLRDATFDANVKFLGVDSTSVIIGGYHGELTVTGDLSSCAHCPEGVGDLQLQV